MKLFIRKTALSAAALLLASLTTLAQAQNSAANYPNAPVKIVVGYSAGGPTDLAARLLAAKLQTAFGQTFLVENKPGAGSNIASEIVAKAKPDGYTLLMAAAPLTTNGFVFKDLSFDALKSFEPISQVMSAPSILAVPPSSVKTIAELIAMAKKDPGKLSFASSGPAGTQHLAGELFQQKAGIKLIHVPYKGSAPALNDLLAGQVSMGFMTSLSSIPFFQEGKLRALAVAANHRLAQLPDVPTMAEVGLAGVEIDSWSGILAPANTPPAIIEKLQREVRKALASPDLNEKLSGQGAVVVGSSPAEFRTFLVKETDSIGKLLKSINLSIN